MSNFQEACMSRVKKPPLGIEPRRIFLENRLHLLAEAVQRYLEAQAAPIPEEWVAEWNDLLVQLS